RRRGRTVARPRRGHGVRPREPRRVLHRPSRTGAMSVPDTIAGAARALRDGSVTAVDLLESVLERAHLTEAQLHAYLNIDRDGARAAAEAADADLAAGNDRGP